MRTNELIGFANQLNGAQSHKGANLSQNPQQNASSDTCTTKRFPLPMLLSVLGRCALAASEQRADARTRMLDNGKQSKQHTRKKCDDQRERQHHRVNRDFVEAR